MKTIFLTTLFLVVSFSTVAQQNQAYVKAMKQGLETLENARTLANFQEAAGQFERIAAVAKDQWHPAYYAALSYIQMSSTVDPLKEKDQLTDKAQKFIDAALSLAPDNAELIALQGYKYMIELSADAGNRGPVLSSKAMAHFGKSLAIEPKNPRANLFMAQMEFGMAGFFGSSTDKSCARGKQALALFNEEPESDSFDPTWGKSGAESFVKQCKQ